MLLILDAYYAVVISLYLYYKNMEISLW